MSRSFRAMKTTATHSNTAAPRMPMLFAKASTMSSALSPFVVEEDDGQHEPDADDDRHSHRTPQVELLADGRDDHLEDAHQGREAGSSSEPKNITPKNGPPGIVEMTREH